MTESSEVTKVEFAAGEPIFFEGDLDLHFYIVEQGLVQIFTKSKTGQRIDIAVIGEGDSFGEFALLERRSRSASAQAITACSLVKVSEAGYQQLLNEIPVWASSMLRSFADRIKLMNDKLKGS